ncbi:MAG: glycoside hydrolase family 27 protein [Acutalibacteraceae bacterium]|nr:glycoside hydrolase family 27 protein [Acutalibacteraceae bacterium]
MHKKFALTPPMGWNSWDCYGASVNEEELKANADYMAKYLKDYGWEYIVCDIQWSEPTADCHDYHYFAPLCMDEYSRLIPAVERFPSSAGGKGFKPIADYIHSLGLKFGIHIMRGIPRQAAHMNTKIKCEGVTARDIAHPSSICSWNPDMYGLFTDVKGAQEYYDSIFELYAEWGVDYVKCDDIANTEMYPNNPYSARKEIEMLRKAIDKCGRPMVLSLSPGPAPVWEHEHLAANANLWRMTGDFWDEWSKLHDMFERCYAWQEYVQPGAWPDCDMLPIGHLKVNPRQKVNKWIHYTYFTHDEQITMMTLWGIFRSPLMIGGEMRDNDEFTLSLLQNKELIDMLKNSSGARQFKREETDGKGEIIWVSNGENCKYVALFNTDDAEREISFDINNIAVGGIDYSVWDMWEHEEYTVTSGSFSAKVNPHGAKLFRIKVR